MRTFIFLSFLAVLCLSAGQNCPVDLSKKEDLQALGIGKIIEKDNSIIKKIALHEVGSYWIVYLKDNSLHDLMMEKIDRIEFWETKWGPLQLRFPGNKPEIAKLHY